MEKQGDLLVDRIRCRVRRIPREVGAASYSFFIQVFLCTAAKNFHTRLRKGHCRKHTNYLFISESPTATTITIAAAKSRPRVISRYCIGQVFSAKMAVPHGSSATPERSSTIAIETRISGIAQANEDKPNVQKQAA
jgi:hypothetical protein